MIESGQRRAAAATASPLKHPSNATVLCYQHHGCLSGSLTHARMLNRVPEYLPPGEGQIFVPRSVSVAYGSEAQLYEIKESTIVHFAATDAMLIAYVPALRMHESRCKGPLCADGIGYSVKV